MSLEQNSAIARAAHEADRAYCASQGFEVRVPWEDLDREVREVARLDVIRIRDEIVGQEINTYGSIRMALRIKIIRAMASVYGD